LQGKVEVEIISPKELARGQVDMFGKTVRCSLLDLVIAGPAAMPLSGWFCCTDHSPLWSSLARELFPVRFPSFSPRLPLSCFILASLPATALSQSKTAGLPNPLLTSLSGSWPGSAEGTRGARSQQSPWGTLAEKGRAAGSELRCSGGKNPKNLHSAHFPASLCLLVELETARISNDYRRLYLATWSICSASEVVSIPLWSSLRTVFFRPRLLWSPLNL
jgi:hypothetical protein